MGRKAEKGGMGKAIGCQGTIEVLLCDMSGGLGF
jgi:hypothetical protein